MFYLVLKKMIRNKWLVLCLLVGSILVVAMVSGIPVYSDAVFQRMLTKDIAAYQTTRNLYPGSYSVKIAFTDGFARENRISTLNYFRDAVPKMAAAYKLPSIASTERLSTPYLVITPTRAYSTNKSERMMQLESLSNVGDKLTIVQGGMFSADPPTEGVVEVVVNHNAIVKKDLMIGETYTIADKTNKNWASVSGRMPLIKIVGEFQVASASDAFWNYTDNMGIDLDNSMVMNPKDYEKYFMDPADALIANGQWYYAFDYGEIRTRNLGSLTAEYQKQELFFTTYYKNSGRFAFPVAKDLFLTYSKRQSSLATTLLILEIPLLLMLAFYIFMVAQLKVENEKNDIAVMKSRGASRGQIFLSYLMESGLLSGISLILGPPVGLLLCKMLGATNGFLEFVNRKALPVALGWKAYLYALVSLVFFTITILIPAFQTSKTSIVEYKQKKSRVEKTNFWKKYFLDVLLLLLSGYGLYQYSIKQQAIKLPFVTNMSEQAIDPMLFLISTFFILGCGLLFLRLYPYLVRLVFWVGRKIWNPVLYASFIQVSRSRGKEQFIMIFMILTLSIGIFSANTARTLNSNVEDKVRYMAGADLVVQGEFKTDAVTPVSTGEEAAAPTLTTVGAALTPDQVAKYYEPDFGPFTQIHQMAAYTKVFKMDKYLLVWAGGKNYEKNVAVMGIVPNEFGAIAYMPDGLYPYSWRYLLNFLAETPNGCLISSQLRDDGKVQLGDSVNIRFPNEKVGIDFVVVGFIDYWPSYNLGATAIENNATVKTRLVVANIDYIMTEGMLRPYEVWYRRSPGASMNTAAEDFKTLGLTLTKWSDLNSTMIERKNDPYLNGTNGTLTLGFIITILISTIGFIIYWLLTIRGRILQFGIFRAMGLSIKKLFGLILAEQLMISGVAIGLGIAVGTIASRLFVPLIQLGISQAGEPLPFRIVTMQTDYLRVYTFSSLILVAGLLVVGAIVYRININAALKLGED